MATLGEPKVSWEQEAMEVVPEESTENKVRQRRQDFRDWPSGEGGPATIQKKKKADPWNMI